MTAYSPSNDLAPAPIRVTLDSAVRLNVAGLQVSHRTMLQQVKADMVFDNPEYVELIRLGKKGWGVPPTVTLYDFDRRTKDLVLPRGYLSGLFCHLAEAEVEWEVEDQTVEGTAVKYPRQVTLRDYQEEPVRAAVHGAYGVIVAPPGAGKTACGLAVIGQLGRKALWITHTLDLARQTLEAAQRFLGLDGNQLGLIGDGSRDTGTHLTVGMVQTLSQHSLQDWPGLEDVGVVVVDECHHQPCATFRSVVATSPARYRIGLTATPERADGMHPVLYAVIGPILAEITSQELVDAERILKPVIYRVKTGVSFAFEKDLKAALREMAAAKKQGFRAREVDKNAADGFNDVLDRLGSDEGRNHLISELVACEAGSGHSVLVLSPRIAHLKRLQTLIAWKLGEGVVKLLTGQTKGRQAIIEDARARKIRVLLATQLADEGLDIPVLDRLVLAMPKRAASKAVQQIGRILRPAEGKTDAVVYDLVDDVGVLISQWRSRRRAYLTRGFDVRDFPNTKRVGGVE